MSVAVELWRALEAWNADRHPRGPGGRFIKPGGGSERPSLADVVRGTAAGGPKRQRADKGGMSVADAVRSAARRSDGTGRPTQRTPAHHRAEGAHDVADEVDRALADHGVPEAMRADIAARARAVADGHGKRPSTKLAEQDTRDLEDWLHQYGTDHRRSGAVQRELDRRKAAQTGGPPPAARQPKPASSTAASRLAETPTSDLEAWLHQYGAGQPRSHAVMKELERRRARDASAPSVVTPPPASPSLPNPARPASTVNAAHETAVRDAVAKLSGGRDEWVGLADLRAELGGMSREEQDATLRTLVRSPGVQIEEQTNQKALHQRDRDAAISIGARDQHVIKIGPAPASGRPRAPRAPRAPRTFDRAAAATVASKLETASSMDDGHAALDGLTVPQLRQVAEMLGVATGSGDTKAKARDRIVDAVVGRRLDSAAIDRMTRR